MFKTEILLLALTLPKQQIVAFGRFICPCQALTCLSMDPLIDTAHWKSWIFGLRWYSHPCAHSRPFAWGTSQGHSPLDKQIPKGTKVSSFHSRIPRATVWMTFQPELVMNQWSKSVKLWLPLSDVLWGCEFPLCSGNMVSGKVLFLLRKKFIQCQCGFHGICLKAPRLPVLLWCSRRQQHGQPACTQH